ncbi:MAG: FAD-binding protein [Magnetococcus sp. WYHC-3]
MNAAIDPRDTWESHAFDTVKGSDYIGDEDAIQLMCREAPEAVLEMDRLGAPFSRTEAGGVAQRAFGGASFNRTCFAADRTGQIMLHTLWERIVAANVRVYEEVQVLQLVTGSDGAVCGVVALDIKTGELFSLSAPAVLMATGGYGRVFLSNTNAQASTGDGMALALRAGAPLADMEFVQFHPTGLLTSGVLVTEGARGEGGFLINAQGERFMQKYAPTKRELASRDVVSRGEQTEINEGRGVNGAIFLDLRHLGAARIMERLPQIRQLAMDLEGVDPIKEPVPVRPTAHYSMGGIRTDAQGAAALPGLYAAGEAACVSVHGANRLGGNSLLDTIVFGRITGALICRQVAGRARPEVPAAAVDAVRHSLETLRQRPDRGVRHADLHHRMSGAMVAHCGVFRTPQGMAGLLDQWPELRQAYGDIHVDDKSMAFNTDLLRAWELGNLMDLAECILRGALARTESRGAHSRVDFPRRDDTQWRRHTLAWWDPATGAVRLDYAPVRTLGLTEYTPKERVY